MSNQKPVAWGVMERSGRVWYVSNSKYTCEGYANHYKHLDHLGFDQEVVPLYTTPPKFQPLTEEEIQECEHLAAIRHNRHKHSIRGQMISPADDLNWHFARAIESKLEEKNT